MEKDDRNLLNKDRLIMKNRNHQNEKSVGKNREDDSSTLNPSFLNTRSVINDNEYEVTSESDRMIQEGIEKEELIV